MHPIKLLTEFFILLCVFGTAVIFVFQKFKFVQNHDEILNFLPIKIFLCEMIEFFVR